MSDYIKLFDSKTQQDNFAESENYTQPHVSCTKGGGNLKYNNGSGGITADSITPELLENADILRRIRNWGLSDEKALQFPRMSIWLDDRYPPSLDEDLMYIASTKNNTIGEITFNGTDYQDMQYIEGHFIDDFKNVLPEYINYSLYDGSVGIVLKKTSSSETDAWYSSVIIDGIQLRINFKEYFVELYIGVNTL